MDSDKPSNPPQFKGQARGTVRIAPRLQGHLTVRLKHNLAASILEAAATFAVEARQLESAAAADPGAQERHRPNVLASVVLAAAFLEGAVNETFLVVWQKPGKFKGEGEVAAWLWGIAIRTLLHRLRPR